MSPIAEHVRHTLGPLRLDICVGEIPVGDIVPYLLENGEIVRLRSDIHGFTDQDGRHYEEREELVLAGHRVAKATNERKIPVSHPQKAIA